MCRCIAILSYFKQLAEHATTIVPGPASTAHDEAAEILIRLFNTLAAGMGKRLKEEYKAETGRACELLATDGTLAPLDDLPCTSPAETASAFVLAAERDSGYQEWRKRRAEQDRK